VVSLFTAFAQNDGFDDMVRTERRFAARGLVVGWKQAFLEYFADSAAGFDDDQVVPAKELFHRLPDPPKDQRLLWEPRYGDIASSGDLGYLTGPVRRINPAVNECRPQHLIYASVWKRQADGSFRVVMDMGVQTPAPVMFPPGFTRARPTEHMSVRPPSSPRRDRCATRMPRSPMHCAAASQKPIAVILPKLRVSIVQT